MSSPLRIKRKQRPEWQVETTGSAIHCSYTYTTILSSAPITARVAQRIREMLGIYANLKITEVRFQYEDRKMVRTVA